MKDNHVNFDKLKQSLKKTEEELTHQKVLSEKEEENILKKRAEALAVEKTSNVLKDVAPVVVFSISNELYGIEPNYINRVCSLKEITLLPSTPKFIKGLINVYGSIVPVFDMRKIFELPEKQLTNKACIVVVESNQSEIGILADELVGIRNISFDLLQNTIPTLSGVHGQYLKGITSDQLIIFDVNKLLADTKFTIDDKVS